MKLPKIALHWKILIGIAVGIVCGILFAPYVQYVRWVGDLFLRGLKMIVIPIVFSSIYMGVAGMGESKNLGRIAGKTFAFYILTTLIAVIIGLVMVTTIKPGVGVQIPLGEIPELAKQTVSIGDQLLGIVSDNIFKDLAAGNMLPIIFFAMILGFFTIGVDEKYQVPLKNFFSAIYEVMLKITLFILKFTPYGVFAIVSNMIADQIGDTQRLLGMAGSLGLFVITIWCGCLIQGFIILPAFVRFIGKENPWKHIKKMSTPLLTAFTTCSSGATLPLSIEYSQKECGISQKISSFTLPLGATINMNGTALFECVAALFIAQIYGIELTITQQIVVVLTSLLAAIGTASIPMAGLVMMTIVFNAVGLPLEGIGLVLAVNQLCEMPRTYINVYGDLCGAVVVAKTEGEQLSIH